MVAHTGGQRHWRVQRHAERLAADEAWRTHHQYRLYVRACGLTWPRCLLDKQGRDPGIYEILALDAAPLGILVNSVSPGGIATERLTTLFGSPEAGRRTWLLFTQSAIPAVRSMLRMPSASWHRGRRRSLTGADLMVDGGYTAQ